MRILSISCGRSDLSILAPVWRALESRDNIELHVLLTGAHVSDDSAARALLPPGAIGHTVGADMAGNSGAAVTASMASILNDVGRIALRISPDRALVIGDRLDMLPAALALVPLNIPIIHLHGGELTYGALDDRVRHAMTKLAHLHCAATVDAATRLVRMGEESWRIRVTGAPGLDTLAEAPVLDALSFAQAVGFDSLTGLRLVTVHPETNAAEPLAALDAVLSALASTPGQSIITAPNADPGGDEAKRRIDNFASTAHDVMYHEALGPSLYPNALRHASVMVGNSSSGIIEAGLFGLPVINVGRRQDGRLRESNVMDCKADSDEVAQMLRNLPSRFPNHCVYGDGAAAPRVADYVTEEFDSAQLLYKRFAADSAEFVAPW